MPQEDAAAAALPSSLGFPGGWLKYYSFWAVRWLGLLALLLYAAREGIKFLGYASSADQYIDKVFILSGFSLLLVGVIFREISLTRKEKYANVFPRIEVIHSTVREINNYLHSIDTKSIGDRAQFEKLVRSRIVSVLDNTCEIFSMLTGTSCRAAIKCVINDNGKIFVYAFARDSSSSEQNSKRDKERFEKKSDPIEGNEDFYSIFEEDVTSYIENDITNKLGYQNTSFTSFGKSNGANARSSILGRLGIGRDWKLPYRSTMVFPVQQRESSHLHFRAKGCIGFLAIDSGFRNVFKERFDGPLGAGLAHALFVPLVRYEQILEELREREAKDGQQHLDAPPREGGLLV